MTAPIFIAGNGGLEAAARENGWPGDGSEESPFIIRDLTIDASTAVGITLRHITHHVRIENNTILNPPGGQTNGGVHLYASQWTTVIGNTIDVEGRAIAFIGSNYEPLHVWVNYERQLAEATREPTWAAIDNTISGGTQGIHTERAGDITISGNTIGDGEGIYVDDVSRRVTVSNNTLSDVDYGVGVSWDSWDVALSYNKVTRCETSGIWVGSYANERTLNIVGNHVSHCAWGILARDLSEKSRVIGNTIEDVKGEGIFLSATMNARIAENQITRAGAGIQGWELADGAIDSNTITDVRTDGIRVPVTGDVTNNELRNIGRHGIVAEFTRGSTVANNTLTQVGGTGIKTDAARLQGNTILGAGEDGINGHGTIVVAVGNVVRDAGWSGIVLSEADAIVDNEVSGSGLHGIHAKGYRGPTEGNVVTGNGGDGIHLANLGPTADFLPVGYPRPPGLTLSDNTATGNGGAGFHVRVLDDAFSAATPAYEDLDVRANVAADNAVGMRLERPGRATIHDNQFVGNELGLELAVKMFYDGAAANAPVREVWNNEFDNTVNAVAPKGFLIEWSRPPTPAAPTTTNIVGGPVIAGNYWSDYAGTDSLGTGVGDTPHQPTADAARLDQYPLVR